MSPLPGGLPYDQPLPELGGHTGIPIMKFTLTYDGQLPAASNNSNRTQEKWEIKKQLSPQLAHLWKTHPALIRAIGARVVPKSKGFWLIEPHHSIPHVPNPEKVGPDEIDLCASIPVAGVGFRPLVRDSYALTCSLHILFMRNEPVGKVYQGGDLDNRLKTLLDALRVPDPGQVCDTNAEHLHVLVEDDSLVTGLSVDTRRLLDRPDKPVNEVRLVIEVTVTVRDTRAYNYMYLGE